MKKRRRKVRRPIGALQRIQREEIAALIHQMMTDPYWTWKFMRKAK